MTRFTDKRSRCGGLFAVALAAIAIVALPGLASARDDSSDSTTTIKSFDATTRTLVLSLPDGETLTGLVGRRTRVRCKDQNDHRRGRDIRGREAEPGDDHGGHGEEAGDDNGGREAEPGDDRGGHGEEPGDDNGGAAEPGDDNSNDSSGPGPSGSSVSGHDDNGHGANCGVADLVPGATVDEVDVDFGHSGVHFDEVELDG